MMQLRRGVYVCIVLTLCVLHDVVRCIDRASKYVYGTSLSAQNRTLTKLPGNDAFHVSPSPTEALSTSSIGASGVSWQGTSDLSVSPSSDKLKSDGEVTSKESTDQQPSTKRKRGRPKGSRNIPAEWKTTYINANGKKAAMRKFLQDYATNGQQQLAALESTDDQATIEAKNEKLRRSAHMVTETISMPAIDQLTDAQLTPLQRALKERLKTYEGDRAGMKSFLRVLGNGRSTERAKATKAKLSPSNSPRST